jgi:NAD(P)-dependent dehydrogenase (short-subunit alcohol dehydrogenase family)
MDSTAGSLTRQKEIRMAMNGLTSKRVVITGAASGLGRSLALVLAAKGCKIGIADINIEGARETLEMVASRGGSGETYELDVSVPEEVEAMAGHFFAAWGGVDLLVNNAGVAVTGFVGDIPLEDWEWIFGINFWGMVYGCHSFIPRMRERGGGHILNVASSAGLLTLLEMSPYNTSKAGIIALSETLKEELAPDDIGVTVLCPMFFNTHLLDSMRYTDEFEPEFAHATFDNARMTSDLVAEAAVKAVEKGKLYCIPQRSGRVLWALKRLNPGLFYGTITFMNKRAVGRPLFLWMARKGLLQ